MVKRICARWRAALADHRADRCCRKFLRLLHRILVLAETVATAPCDVVLCQLTLQVRSVYIQGKFLPADAAGFSGIAVRDTKPAAFIVYETVKRDPALRPQIKPDGRIHVQRHCA